MKITVIIPVYNAESYLVRAIESVLSQPQVDELILVEDGSSDSSKEVCMKAAATNEIVELLYHPGNANKGVSASRNLGIKNAKNNFIAFLDADDYYLPNRFKATSESFAFDESIDGVYEMIGIHSETGEATHYSVIEPVNPDILFESLQPLGHKVWFHIDGLTVKKSVFTKSGYFDESLKTSEDTLHWFKMASICKLVPGEVKKIVASSEKISTGLSSNRSQVEKDFILMLLKLFKFSDINHLGISKKELVVSKLLYFISRPPYNYYYNGLNRISLFAKLISVSPGYLIFKSSSFRLSIGNLFSYKGFYLFR
jgi:glycosyltransferase involved in cell wall biosynthesis